MTGSDDASEQWQPWVEEACRAVGVDPSLVDTEIVLSLTREVAHRFTRPMAPVAAYILGLAVAQAGAGEAERLVGRVVDSLPSHE
ncbi:DUF6457 domain-containing protein [Tessaracoccus sp. G1721]